MRTSQDIQEPSLIELNMCSLGRRANLNKLVGELLKWGNVVGVSRLPNVCEQQSVAAIQRTMGRIDARKKYLCLRQLSPRCTEPFPAEQCPAERVVRPSPPERITTL